MFHTRNASQNTAEFVLLGQLVEEDHLLRKIDKYIDFSFIVEKAKPYYSEHKGRPSLDPLILFKMMLKIAAYLPSKARRVGVLFLRLKKKQDKT